MTPAPFTARVDLAFTHLSMFAEALRSWSLVEPSDVVAVAELWTTDDLDDDTPHGDFVGLTDSLFGMMEVSP